ncbi:MAG TPA: calcium-translocating P-type ATPase, PMCA-type, partial [Tenuifilaceae bacterium]|nr:calcium-translocating P-type ATPase, PMCA-type [Tenuifilaceae bacterium]
MVEIKYKGLSEEQVVESRAKFGENVLTPPVRKPWWRLLLEKFNDPIIRILTIAAVIAIAVGAVNGHYLEGVGIIVAIFLATFMSFINEYRAGKEFDILNQVNEENPVKVIRNGGVTSIPKKDVVVGDIVIVDRGDEIPSDGVLLESVSLSVNESSLTGEPIAQKSYDSSLDQGNNTYPINRVYKGTAVVEGHGIYETTSVGDSTEIGKTARESTLQVDIQTPLTKQLNRLSDFIGSIAFLLAILIFVLLVVADVAKGTSGLSSNQQFILVSLVVAAVVALMKFWLPSLNFLVKAFGAKRGIPDIFAKPKINSYLLSFLLGLAVVVVAIPIAFAKGIDLADSANWFSVDFISKLLNYFMVSMTLIVVAVPEGLAMSVTLSLAYSMRKMTADNNLVRKLQATETMGAVTVVCTDKTGTLTQNRMAVLESSFSAVDDISENSLNAELIKYSMAVNSTAHLDFTEKSPAVIGNPTDAALLLWLNNQGINYQSIRNDFTIEQQLPFSSEKKYMLTVGKAGSLNKRILLVKGAPEVVISMCEVDDILQAKLTGLLESYQQKSLRTIAFAYRFLDHEVVNENEKPSNLNFIGVVGIADPVRLDAAEAVAQCHRAGVDVKMLTGDNIVTATSIGKQVNILSGNAEANVISGPDFEALSEDEARRMANQLKIMYRARPSDKMRLVRLLQENGQVVAVTGDGTNDAPSLNRADVGLAMGSGTQVAKEASDIILLDDSFSSIVNAIRWGRTLYGNIQKFLFFQLTINLLAVVIVLTGPFTGITLPLTVTQMLWVNLIMDTFAALALATEQPHAGVLNKPPRSPKEFIVTPSIFKGILLASASFLIILLGMLIFFGRDGNVSSYELTLFFNLFVMLQFWNLFNSRSLGDYSSALKGLFHNKGFITIAFVILLGQVVIIQWGGEIFRTVPLSLSDWVKIFVASSLVLWIPEAYRFFKRISLKNLYASGIQ